MHRTASDYLKKWLHSPIRMPLVIRGARQTGKSYLVEKFAKNHFKYQAMVNLEVDKHLHSIFDTLDPKKICQTISATSDVSIVPGKTLLFLDEIQTCPAALQSLRYFFEQMPELHVIAAGSLLEFILFDTDFSMPVGRVEYLYLQAMSFEEFLLANNAHQFLEYINQCKVSEAIPEAIHHKGLEWVKQYCVVGGMPKAVKTFIQHQDISLTQQIQDQLLNTYRDDFYKYGNKINTEVCELIFSKSPNLIAQHFKYTDIDPDRQSKQIKPSLTAMIKAGIYHEINAVEINGIPLTSNIIKKKRKLAFMDTALIKRMSKIDAELLLSHDLHLVNRGQLAEQYVGQELIAYQELQIKPALYYWERNAKNSSAEVDFVYQLNEKIVPIEVKAGSSGRLKSLQMFLGSRKKNPYISPIGLKISKESMRIDNRILSIPFYLIGQTNRLLLEAIDLTQNQS
jgi:predicted AAA+ superfamily ATPase